MKNKKTRRFKIRYIVFGLLGVMALAALVFMRFGGFGTGENVNPEEFLAYAEPVENITVPESAKIIALGEATHGNAEFQQLKLEVFKQMVKNNGVRAFALEGDYGGCEQVNRYIHGGEGTAQEAAAAIGFSIYRTEEMAELISYPEHDRTGGFSFASVLLDEDDLSKVMQDKNVVDCEERTFGNYEGVYLKYNDLAEDGSFNQRIYLLRPDVYRVITVYIGDDISKEDVIKVVENLVITENDTMIETAGLYTWSEMVSPEESSGEAVMTSIADNKLLMHQIGEVFDISASGEDRDGNYIENDKISVCVDAVHVGDNLQLLGQNNVPEEWTDAVGTDGNLVNNTLSYIKSGNGIDSVDEIVKTESVKQKLVYATVTYTNKSDEEINHVLYIGTLLLMDHEDGSYQIYDPTEQSGDDYDRVIWDGVARTAEMTYNSISEDYGNGGNYISSLKPGESIQVNMAWIVNENDLNNMYLNLNGDGAAYEFSDSMLKTGLVDIYQ